MLAKDKSIMMMFGDLSVLLAQAFILQRRQIINIRRTILLPELSCYVLIMKYAVCIFFSHIYF